MFHRIFYMFIFTSTITTNLADIDPLGYIAYCPCMGRFGNQADHFLGSLRFSHDLNRTLILPPWVEYRYGEPRSIQVPFDRYFKVEPLRKYHKVITMEKFMKEIAPDEWPKEERISFCYTTRGDDSCNAKEGNPFGPFWDTFDIDFVKSEFYNPLHYDTLHGKMAQRWKEKYPPEKWPVLAFTGAPASFPVQAENINLQQYLEWSEEIARKADDFIRDHLPKGAFIGIHLRNGIDWVRACDHIPDSPNLFAAPQCLGYRNENGKATQNMCFPTKQTIIRKIKRVVKKFHATNRTVKSLFVASDSNHMLDDLNESLHRMEIRAFKYDQPNPHVELAILGKANFFIGNCISSFSAFVKRERDAKAFPSGFWDFPQEKANSKRDEL